jgi:lantibiotic modifying enzyme
VLRATRVYGAIQARQITAAALRSEREQLFALEPLARLYLTSTARPRDWPALAAERRQMRDLDVPFFDHLVDSIDLRMGDGQPDLAGVFARNGLDACRQRLAELDRAEIAFQLRLVRGAVAAKAKSSDRPRSSDHRLAARGAATAGPPGMRTAEQIARRLMVAGFDGGTRWLGFECVGDDRWCQRPLLPSLYGGTLGIALFFACLSRAGSSDVLGLDAKVHRLLAPLARLDSAEVLRRWWRDQPLGLAGVGGTLLALLALEELRVAPPGFASARQLALHIVAGADLRRFDGAMPIGTVGGVTGLVGPLLRIGGNAARALAAQAGHRLVRDAPGWMGTAGRGFDGVDGLLVVLAALGRDNGPSANDPSLADALRQCRAAAMVDPASDATGWRDGLAGTVLARLCLAAADGADAAAALNTARLVKRLAGSGFCDGSLAYGAAGGAAVVGMATVNGAAKVWLPPGDLRHIARLGLRCDDPGLMTGASGAGLVAINDAASRRALATILSAGLLDRPFAQDTKLSKPGIAHLTT